MLIAVGAAVANCDFDKNPAVTPAPVATTSTPEPTPTATPEPTPHPDDTSWAPPGSLAQLDAALIPLLRELVLAGRVSWRAPQWIWPDINPFTGISYQDMSRYRPLIESGSWADESDGSLLWRLETRTSAQVGWDAVQAEADAAGWEPAFPGAARTLFDCFPVGRNAGCESSDPEWVAHLGLDLPPTILPHDRHPYAGFDNWLQDYRDDQIGFHPPLRPGVNVTYAVKVDLNDSSLRPECPQLVKVERLQTSWHWPRGLPGFFDDPSYEGYLARIRNDGSHFGRPPVELDSGWGTIWSEADGTWRWRQTVNTPYGWHTFDIDTMQMRPVDTSPGSWDSLNLWLPHGGGGAYDSLGVAFRSWGYRLSELAQFGGSEIVDNSRFFQFVRANPWPVFDPWHEVLLPGQEQTRPLLYPASDYEWWSQIPRTGYMRLTCGE